MTLHGHTSTAKAAINRCSILFLCCCVLTGCSKSSKDDTSKNGSGSDTSAVEDSRYPGDPLDLNIAYELTEDKSRTAALYNDPELKEWYPTRVQPPPFDYAMNLAGKSYLELRLLRYEIFARNGHLFKDAALRWHFNTFPWYQPVFDAPGFKVQINAQEKAFLDRVAQAEEVYQKDKYVTVQGNMLVGLDHVVNLAFSGGGNDSSRTAFRTMNMAILPSRHDQLFYVYDENQYGFVPNFITTDLYLQVLHKYLGSLMKGIEESRLNDSMRRLLSAVQEKAEALSQSTNDQKVRKAADWADTYLAVGLSVRVGEPVVDLPAMPDAFQEEYDKVMNAEGNRSDFLQRTILDYSQFKPRGDYTENDARKGYFRCVKWLNDAPMNIDDDASFMAALFMACWIQEDAKCREQHAVLSGVITFLAGEEDDLSIGMVAALLARHGIHSIDQILAPGKVEELRTELKAMNVSRIDPKAGNDLARQDFAKKAILFTPGRYSLDGELLLRTVHVARPDIRRPFPRGLDVFAAMGNGTAERILNDTYQEAQKWPAYSESLAVAKSVYKSYDRWDASLYGKMLQTIRSVSTPGGQDVPLFMRTTSWHTKELNTTLAAWTELKHDMVLYSEQPYAAEAGEGGGPEPPVHLSYVEPNVAFWSGAVALLEHQEKVLTSLGVFTDEAKHLNGELKEIASFMLAISRKELAGERVTEKEFRELTWIGGRIESITIRIYGGDHLPEREKQIALVTDVYARNGRYLEEAVGLGDELYVIAEINGVPYLTRGACFSYYEFQSDERLSNEQWQAMLAKPGAPERPEWMKPLYLRSSPWKRMPGSESGDIVEHH